MAAYPMPELRVKKFWPTIKRIDVYGDATWSSPCKGSRKAA